MAETFATCPACGRFCRQTNVVWAPLLLGDSELHLHMTCGVCRSTRIQIARTYDHQNTRTEFYTIDIDPNHFFEKWRKAS